MKQFLTILILVVGAFYLPAQVNEEVQVDAWSESPAKQKLEQIEKYKPQVRRSRIIAIQELEEDLNSAKESIFKAKRLMRYQLSPDGRRSKEAWDSLEIETAQAELDSLQAFVKEAETFLAYAKEENEKVMKYLVRERSGMVSDSLSGEEEEDDEDEDDESDEDGEEGVDPDPQLRVKTRLSPQEEEDED